MRHRLIPAVLTLAAVAAPGARAAHAQPVTKAQPASSAGAALPTGWQMQLDRATMPADQAKFVTMGTGYHATMGRSSGIFFNPQTTATGAYTVDASFRQTKAPTHPEAYGLVIGGSKLGTDAPDYLYYIVRGTGEFMIRHRAGTEVHTIQDWKAHPAIKAQDAQGAATNALRVAVAADTVRFFANGTEVAKFPKAAYMNTDGVVGVRINHGLDVHVDGPRVTPAR